MQQRNTYELNGSYQVFLDEASGLRGISDQQEQIILPAEYIRIEWVGNPTGIVAYSAQFANFYSLPDGKKQLTKDYYDVKVIDGNTFIVQTLNGYGILQNNQFVVADDYHQIEVVSLNGETFYHLVDLFKHHYILDKDFKTATHYLPYPTKELIYFDERYFFNNYNLYDIPNNKKLICDEGFQLQLISKEHRLLAIQRIGEKVWYLIDFEGKLVSSEAFHTIHRFNDDGNGMVQMRDKEETSKRISFLYGIINHDGKWVLQPSKKRLGFLMNSPDYLIHYKDENPNGQHFPFGIMRMDGKQLTKAIYEQFNDLDNGFLHLTKDRMTNPKYYLFNTKNSKTKSTTYRNITPIKDCFPKIHLAYDEDGSHLLDDELQPINKENGTLTVVNNYIIEVRNQQSVNRQVLDCNGDIIAFECEGKAYDTFIDVRKSSRRSGSPKRTEFVLPDNKFLAVQDEDIRLLNEGDIQKTKLDRLPISIVRRYTSPKKHLLHDNGTSILEEKQGGLGIVKYDDTHGMFLIRLKHNHYIGMKWDGTIWNDMTFSKFDFLGYGLIVTADKQRSLGVLNEKNETIIPYNHKFRSITMHGGIIWAEDQYGTIFQYDRLGNGLGE